MIEHVPRDELVSRWTLDSKAGADRLLRIIGAANIVADALSDLGEQSADFIADSGQPA
jgi:hypothetical protein